MRLWFWVWRRVEFGMVEFGETINCLWRNGEKLIWILGGLFGLFNFCLLCIVKSLIAIHDIFLLG